jgi:phosphatidylserine/phosphatidylglycerophosphate/cardiolipin synthase-like enzyme
MYYKRLAAYSALGYLIQTPTAISNVKPGTIYNQQSFLSVLSCDIEQAMNEILIVSPYLSKGRVTQMKRLFLTAIAKGVKVVLFTRPSEQKNAIVINELNRIGVKIIFKERIHQKFCIIDRKIVWYGSINLLAYGRSEESMMRFEDHRIGDELLLDMGETGEER